MEYDFQKLEAKWRKIWSDEFKSGKSDWIFDDSRALNSKQEVMEALEAGKAKHPTSALVGKDKAYLLDMFPYPSGSGLHVGHVEEKVAIDIMARYLRMRGTNVLMPTGYDSFGLPTENYAIKNNLSPQVATQQNTQSFREQTEKIGISYDWTRELAASDPEYYKFTQWWFKFLYDRGLAYRKKQSVNWCPQDQTVLANEQVIDGKCERCDSVVVQKELEQWFFRITDYAERLLADLDRLDWPSSTIAAQKNWIGKSEGINIKYLVPLNFAGDSPSNPTQSKQGSKSISKQNESGPQKSTKVLISTHNSKKVKRVKQIIKAGQLNIEVLTLADFDFPKKEVNEGSDIAKNALMKARLYEEEAKKLGIPVIGMDSALFIDGESDLDPAKVRRNVLDANGVKNEEELSAEDTYKMMQDFYADVAKKHGGKVAVEWQDAMAIILPNGEVVEGVGRRPVELRSEKSATVDLDVPISSLLWSEKFQKYTVDFSDEEELDYIKGTAEVLLGALTATVEVFTTRPDTNFGATFIALAPEGQFVRENLRFFPNKDKVEAYIKKTAEKTELERASLNREKTGEFTGLYAVNQLTGRQMPLYVSDFVLGNVGTGALVGVPGHDIRDFEFAKKMGIEILRVVKGPDGDESPITKPEQVQEDEGVMVNSGFLDGMEIMQAKDKIMDFIESRGWGRRVVNYKLRDWSISRQRYWGAPIPMVYRKLDAAGQGLQKRYGQKPEAVFSFHAFGSDNSEAYLPWLSEKLELEGVKSLAPNLPNPELPKLEEWLAVAEKSLSGVQDAENIVLQGRSLGAWSALKYTESKKVRKLILVAPANPVELENRDELKKLLEVSEEQWVNLEEFVGLSANNAANKSSGNVDFEKVAKNAGEIVIFLSKDDPYIPFVETKKFFEDNLPFARIISIRQGAGHFNKKNGFAEFPELLREVLSDVRLDISPVLEKNLPVTLPEDVDYRPQGTAPLGTSKVFDAGIDQKIYGAGAHREYDTMDTFVCSSWYFFRFLDPKNAESMAGEKLLKKVGPVDFYIGGAEHTVLHLLYARFFTKVAYDAGLIDFDEPFLKLRHQGTILGPDNRKMSKRWGNVINPNDVVDSYGADTLRMYEMFMGPLAQTKAWNEGGVKGIFRFLQKVCQVEDIVFDKASQVKDSSVNLQIKLNSLLSKVSGDIESLKFNTAISEMMKFINLFFDEKNKVELSLRDWGMFLKILYPFAPFITSEMWERKTNLEEGNADSRIYRESWPDSIKISGEVEAEKVVIVVMINGKLRDKLEVEAGASQDQVRELALGSEKVKKYVDGPQSLLKEVFVPNKLLNLVVK